MELMVFLTLMLTFAVAVVVGRNRAMLKKLHRIFKQAEQRLEDLE